MSDHRPAPPTVPALVCVPGLGLEAAEWRTTFLALAPSGVVRAMPGYGRRPSRADDLRPAALGERLTADLPAGVVLVGHSASCQVVARAAALAPDRVAALVLVGPTTDPRADTWPRLAARWLRTAAWERPAQVPFLVRSYTRAGPVWMARTMDRARREDVRGDLRAVRCPVLVVRGRHDRICPEDWTRALASLGPAGSRAVTLRRGGHMVPLTHGDLLASTVASWLASVCALPGGA
ncbi:alpha/beta fold hydrolase [Nocardioides sp. SYSU D00065]|uniref:alpha/beta fold hydrolase n=1 Tax=Nocardioides sp. SYSU D00065 TaxID=2817378 RepID=UPI001B319100|nr:alpha/beta hydrolase [Nocardioides sp. SYSU D00065]